MKIEIDFARLTRTVPDATLKVVRHLTGLAALGLAGFGALTMVWVPLTNEGMASPFGLRLVLTGAITAIVFGILCAWIENRR